MELFFLAILIAVMVCALGSGFPVAFALPGAAIVTITLAGLAGVLFAGDSGAFFISGSPVAWLTAGATNFRGIYWEVERDTLIAVPLFIFMGIMLQRSKVAEDLLVTMAQLFGPVPGGLGISVVLVGALLAATTGIVGATVVAMGLISLPAMLRNNYSKPLATGTICASGTLGQIIPPSIVLIILADQLASAADQAASERAALYQELSGGHAMPSTLGIVSASAGDMFLGAFIPGLVLVGLYMAYILATALLRPGSAPSVPFEGDSLSGRFLRKALLALVPPLVLIVAVLGSIIAGIATVNQAGAIGAVGATIMASYRLREGHGDAYYPAIMATVSLAALFILAQWFDLNIRTIESAVDAVGIGIALVAAACFFVSVGWALMRIWKIDDTLNAVMVESAKTTSMVFIILLGAAMLTAGFRAFGGEEVVKHFLTSLPGGFWSQFIMVMLVIFLLGFFLDFIEIAVVVVPIVAPILLADPSANVTAVWLGVMIGLNMQTSFLTPPFGFALFYLRGVASKAVGTLDIYKGAVPFIALQLLGLAIVGFNPSLVNYLPARTQLTSENAPPPRNPRLQTCLEEHLFTRYRDEREAFEAAGGRIAALDLSVLPPELAEGVAAAAEFTRGISSRVDGMLAAEAEFDAASDGYRGIHAEVRRIERDLRRLNRAREKAADRLRRAGDGDAHDRIQARIAGMDSEIAELAAGIPAGWEAADRSFRGGLESLKDARGDYRRNADKSYGGLVAAIATLKDPIALAALEEDPARRLAARKLLPELEAFEASIRDSIGIRQQDRLAEGQAGAISGCLAKHRDISLEF